MLLKATKRNGNAALLLASTTTTTIKTRSKFLVLKLWENARYAPSANVTITAWKAVIKAIWDTSDQGHGIL